MTPEIRHLKDQPPPQTGAATPPQPIRDGQGASILGPTNPARQAQAPDLIAPPPTDHGTLPNLKWSFADSHTRLSEGGWARQTTARELPIATEFAAVNMRLQAGAVRELHWHREAEWAYMIAGRARITAVDSERRAFQDDVSEGDIWYFPAGVAHSIQGLPNDGCEMLLVHDDGHFDANSTFQLTDWLAHTPREVLAKNFDVPESAFANIPTTSFTSSTRRCPARSARSGSSAPGRSLSPSRTTCSPRSRSGRREAASASLTRGCSRHPKRLPRP